MHSVVKSVLCLFGDYLRGLSLRIELGASKVTHGMLCADLDKTKSKIEAKGRQHSEARDDIEERKEDLATKVGKVQHVAW